MATITELKIALAKRNKTLVDLRIEHNRIVHLLDLHAERMSNLHTMIDKIVDELDEIISTGASLNPLEASIHAELVKEQESRKGMESWGKSPSGPSSFSENIMKISKAITDVYTNALSEGYNNGYKTAERELHGVQD